MAQQPTITVTPDEWARGALEPAKLAAALEQLHRTGFTTIENCIPHERLDELVGRLDYDAAHQVASEEKWTERGPFGGGHLQLGLPRCAPFVAPEIVANPILEQLAAAYLGHCYLGFYNGNTNTPGSHFSQPLHLDGCAPLPLVCRDRPAAAGVDGCVAETGTGRARLRRRLTE